nr:carbohydrate-binding protein [Salinicola tamaricis]
MRYANGGSGDRPLLLNLDNGAAMLVSFPPTGGWASWREVQVTLPLSAGSNALTLSLPSAAEGGVPNGPNIDQIAFDYAGEMTAPPTLVASIEGETMGHDDGNSPADTVVRDASHPESDPAAGSDGLWGDYSGSGYLDMGEQAGDAATFQVSVVQAGTYELVVRYANGASDTQEMR